MDGKYGIPRLKGEIVATALACEGIWGIGNLILLFSFAWSLFSTAGCFDACLLRGYLSSLLL